MGHKSIANYLFVLSSRAKYNFIADKDKQRASNTWNKIKIRIDLDRYLFSYFFKTQ